MSKAEHRRYNPNRLATVSVPVAVALGLGACRWAGSDRGDMSPYSSSPEALPPVVVQGEDLLPDDVEQANALEAAKTEMREYLVSDERLRALEATMDEVSETIVDRALSGDGDYDGLYPYSDDFETLRGEDGEFQFREGWVRLQQMSNDGSGITFATMVYTTPEAGFDLSKPALSVEVSQVGPDGEIIGFAAIERPYAHLIAGQNEVESGEGSFVSVSFQDVTGLNRTISGPDFVPGKETPVPSGVTYQTPASVEEAEDLDSITIDVMLDAQGASPLHSDE